MSEKCCRCGGDVTPKMIVVRPGGMTWFTPSNSDFTSRPIEYVCGECITDRELLLHREIGDIVMFATGVLMKDSPPEHLAPFEVVRAYFTTFNHGEDRTSRYRNAALKATGILKESPSVDLESAVVEAAMKYRETGGYLCVETNDAQRGLFAAVDALIAARSDETPTGDMNTVQEDVL